MASCAAELKDSYSASVDDCDNSVGNSEAVKEGDPCLLALDPWPQYLSFIFIVLLIIMS